MKVFHSHELAGSGTPYMDGLVLLLLRVVQTARASRLSILSRQMGSVEVYLTGLSYNLHSLLKSQS